MAINIAGNRPLKPQGVTLAFAGAIVALVAGLLMAFYWSRGSTPPPSYKPEELSNEGVSTNWFHEPIASPAATPGASTPPAQAAAPAVASAGQTYGQTYRATTARNTTPTAAQQALMRAMASDLEVKIEGANVLETPRHDPQQVAVATTPAPPHTLLAWSFIYATLMTQIDSDHSGDVLAKVSHPVRDQTETEVLIPAGSIVHGEQNGTNAMNANDSSLTVVWDDIELPNGAHVPVPKMNGMDATGAPGLSGQIDHHGGQIWLPAILTSAITAGVMLAQNPVYGSAQGYNSTQQASGAFASSMGGIATNNLYSRLMTIHPTIKIAKGTPIRILVNRNFVFPGAYED
jgi:type IV secretory pathway VirB10-like protein